MKEERKEKLFKKKNDNTLTLIFDSEEGSENELHQPIKEEVEEYFFNEDSYKIDEQ